jgi:endo-1,4-beta-D-glucanase Y
MDDFVLNESELHEENKTSRVGKAKLELLNTIEKKLKEAKANLDYSEKTEFNNNVNIMSRYVTAIMEINMMEDDASMSENDMLERIKQIEKTAKELNVEDLRKGDTDGDIPAVVINDKSKFNDDDFSF